MVVKITMNVNIDEKDFYKLKRIEHHVEEFVDLYNWPEIQTVYNVKAVKKERIDEK